jgi:sec-independent protein translocase protein TatB
MDILGVGPLELLFIIIIALVVIGPRDIGNAARSVGRFLNRLYRSEAWQMLSETARNLRHLPSQLAREAAIEELREVQKSVEEVGKDLNQDVKSLKADLQPWTATKPNTETTSPESGPPTESTSDSPPIVS